MNGDGLMKLSIRWALIVGFLALIWGTHLTTTTSTYISSEKVLNQHAMDIMENIADLAMEQSQNHLAHAHAAATLTRRLVSANVVGINEESFDSLERYFLDQLAIYPHFAGIYLGQPDGDFFYVSRDAQKPGAAFRTKIIQHKNDTHSTRLIWRDEQLNVIANTYDTEDDFDPRNRPWYKSADAQRQIVWTDPYIFYTSQKPGITIAGPTYDDRGALQGVIGVDIEIDQLSRFIGNMNIGKHGRAFMINNNGDVVAFPDLEKIKTTGNGPSDGYRLAKIEELDDVLSRKAFSSMGMKAAPDGRYHMKRSQFARFEHNGEYHHAMLTPFSFSDWPWIIGVHLPEDDYLGTLKKNRRDNILLTLALSVVATLMALLLARTILRPMADLEKAALAVKNNDLTTQFQLKSRYKEISETGDAFARMKTAIRDTQEKYIGIFENIQDVYYETAMDGTVLEISPSIEKISELKRDRLIGSNVNRFYNDPDSRNIFIDTLLSQERVTDYEIVLKDSRGEPVYYSVNAMLKKDERGKPEKIIGSMRNTTARKTAEAELREYRTRLEELVLERTADLEKVNLKLQREVEQRLGTEAELREKEEKYRNILESIEEGYFETDLKGKFTFYNHATTRALGLPGNELLGMNVRRFTRPHTAQRILRIFADIYQTGKPRRAIEVEIISKDGTKRFIELSASLIYDAKGLPCGYRGIGRDVTRRLKDKKERRRLTEHLHRTQRLEALGRLAGGIAHDFNNLLMGIQGNASLMLSALDTANSNIENVRSIERCVQSGANLTRQLLGYARGGKYMVKPTNLNDLVRKTAEMFGRTRKEVQIVASYQEDVWIVDVDRIQIEQVLVNVYLNGYQAMAQKGVLHLQTSNVYLDEEFVQPYKVASGRYVKISVKDTGMGMAQDVQAHVFEPFFTTKTIGSGTGLGLASAFGIVKNHSGIIDFASRPMVGTTFFIYLPATEKPLHPEEETDENSIHWGSETILIIDDEHYILEACKAMLNDMGYTVLTARNGEEAVGIYDEKWQNIALVILDMIMPGMDGRQTYQKLQKIDPEVKVLVSSGYSMDDIATEMLAMGCSEFIQKPFHMYKVSKMIRRILDNPPSQT